LHRRLLLYILLFSPIFSLHLLLYEIIHQIAHLKEDKKAGIISLPVKIKTKICIKIAIRSQIFLVLLLIPTIFLHPSKNFIFIGSIFFSLARICKLTQVSSMKNVDFAKIRGKVYGVEEWMYSILMLFLLNFLNF
jgi:4-hydroxybenzoate polyprenyltransferase